MLVKAAKGRRNREKAGSSETVYGYSERNTVLFGSHVMLM